MQPWIKSDYDLSKFSMNEKRIKIFMDHIDSVRSGVKEQKFEDVKDMLLGDVEDMKSVLACLKHNDIKQAVKIYQNCDTAARDEYPQWFWELAGGSINPRFYKPEDSLNGTE